MNEQILNIFELALKLEDVGINFFSGLSRKFHKNIDLKQNFEIYAKSKISTKKLLNDIVNKIKSHSININYNIDIEYSHEQFDLLLDATDVVGEYSMHSDVLKTAFNYLRLSNNLYNFIIQQFDTIEGLEKIIESNKELLEIVKKHINIYTEEVKFYGYE